MTTTRREFIRAALSGVTAFAVAPLLASVSKAAAKPESPYWPFTDYTYEEKPCEHVLGFDPNPEWQSVEPEGVLGGEAWGAMKIPCNYDPNRKTYDGDWDYETFTYLCTCFPQPPCSNPAFILAHLTEKQGGEVDWRVIYDWARFCDEMVSHEEGWQNRFTEDWALQPAEKELRLRNHLRMCRICWEAESPKWRKSWPGIPYPGDNG